MRFAKFRKSHGDHSHEQARQLEQFAEGVNNGGTMAPHVHPLSVYPCLRMGVDLSSFACLQIQFIHFPI